MNLNVPYVTRELFKREDKYNIGFPNKGDKKYNDETDIKKKKSKFRTITRF